MKDFVVWITGGGTGIGQAMAEEYAKQGYKVAISGRRKEKLDSVQKNIEASGGKALAVVCDVVDDAAIQEAITTIVTAWGKLDIVIANAGFSMNSRIEKLTSADWHRQLNVNVVGLTQTIRFSLPYLQQTKGRVVLISSVMGYVRAPKTAAYAASKAAVTAIGATLHLELLGTGISCTVIHPGYVESEIGKVQKDGAYDPSAIERRPKKLLWPKEKAAKVMIRAIEKRKRMFVFTAHGIVGLWIAQHLPGLLYWIQSLKQPKNRKIDIG